MAKRGRKPTPIPLKVARINAESAPGPFAFVRQAGSPHRPETISSDPIASEIWDRMVGMLTDRKILSPADEGILISFCSAYSTVVRCRNLLKPTVDPETGKVREPILGREAKLSALKDEAAAMAITVHDALAVGDGANDLAMIEAAGLGVAYRAKPVVAAQADARVDHADLTALLYFQGYRQEEFVQ